MRIKILTVIIIAVLLSSCNLIKKVLDVDNGSDTGANEMTSNPDMKIVTFTKKLKESYLKYEFLEMKFASRYKNGDSDLPIKGIIKIQKDSCIWVSIRPGLGIELARLLLTKDSIKFINRMKSEYFVEDYKYFEKQLNIKLDYKTIQAILTNEFFIYPAKKTYRSGLVGFKLSKVTGKNILSKSRNLNNYTEKQEVSISSTNNKILSILSEMTRQKRKLDIKYSNFYKLNNTLFPKSIDVKIVESDKNITLDFTYNKITVDKAFKPSFKISPRYTKIKIY